MQKHLSVSGCAHLHYYHPTSHPTKIISPHTHTYTYTYTWVKQPHAHHMCYKVPLTPGAHIVNTLPKWHTCTGTCIHTHKLTHYHPSITLIFPLPVLFLFMLSLSLVKLLTCGVIRGFNFAILIGRSVVFDMLKSRFPLEPALYNANVHATSMTTKTRNWFGDFQVADE